jgi:hypothetical protein
MSNNKTSNSLAYQQQSLLLNPNVINQQKFMLHNKRLNNQIISQHNQQQIYNHHSTATIHESKEAITSTTKY